LGQKGQSYYGQGEQSCLAKGVKAEWLFHEVLMREMEIKDRTAKKYIAYMKEQRILAQDTNGNYQKGELCRT